MRIKTIGLIEAPLFESAYGGQVKAVNSYSKASDTFRRRLKYSKKHYDFTFILSAVNGVITLNEQIVPLEYPLSFFKLRKLEEIWQKKVVTTLKSVLPKGTPLYFLADKDYYSVIPMLEPYFPCFTPLQGMSALEEVTFLDRNL
ncbi:hypothetical protein KBD75_00230 [Candidatus Woesebacteria bacterium]|nr:hypothetical protein [Candidatus Woesebacteria bacterium]